MTTITTTVTIDKGKAEGVRPYVYFFHQGKNIGHGSMWRHPNPIELYFSLLPTILRHAGMVVSEEEEARPTALGTWEPLAACHCGCAPGIALKRAAPDNVYVTIAATTVIYAGDTSARP